MVCVIGGELQERLIPVPYSKSSTDQASNAAMIVQDGFTNSYSHLLACECSRIKTERGFVQG
ncbi:plasma membrane calcium-transporting ATPase 2 [Aphis craccivora]|uniref:Plasma membrane calcium-transporting ATPase 2 n=1 Tax=Aphis craccivora TaxID=307492 RepID=A0A6G0ZKW5_APHCR|nr:plasma membrane calcium-transporting ATPase 2 [Aphis craccivora]